MVGNAEQIVVSSDGGSRGTPGPSAWAFVARLGMAVTEKSGFIETATVNEAEYTAMIEALKWLQAFQFSVPETLPILIQSDSELIVKQILGSYRCLNPNLLPFYTQAIAHYEALNELAPVTLEHIRRSTTDDNKRADELCRITMDANGAVWTPKKRVFKEF